MCEDFRAGALWTLGSIGVYSKRLSAFGLSHVIAWESKKQELPLNADEEKNLITQSQRGDREAYASLVKAYTGPVFAICLAMLKDRHDAEDVTQQTMLKGFMQIRRLRQSERFAAWIGRIARNGCVDAMRRRKRAAALSVGETPSNGDARDYGPLETAISRLDVDYRVPLLLYYFDGKSTQSIATTLGLTQGAIQARLSRARRKLRGLLEAQGDTRYE